VNYTQKAGLKIGWWAWILTVSGFLYSIFVLEVIYSFLVEGVGRAALMIGMMLGIVAVIFGVLMGRLVFKKTN